MIKIRDILMLTLLLVGVWLIWPSQKRLHSERASSDFVSPQASDEQMTPLTPLQDVKPAQGSLQAQILALYNQQDYLGALTAAENSEGASNKERQWIAKQMPQLLIARGFELLKQQQCDDALPLFDRALQHSELALAHKGRSFCLKNLRALAEAAISGEITVQMEPRDGEMRWILVEIYETQGNMESALHHLDQMLDLGAIPDGILSEQLKETRRAMAAKFLEAGQQVQEFFAPFRISFRPTQHEDLIPMIQQILSEGLHDLVEIYGCQYPQNEIEVLLYTQENYADIVPGAPEWAAGIFDGRIRIPIPDQELHNPQFQRIREVIRHELSHAVLFQMHSGLPTWFNEGFAQFFEASRSFAFDAQVADFMPKEAFEGPFLGLSAHQARSAYQQSLYLVKALARIHPEGRGALRQLIESLSSHQDKKVSGQVLLSKIQMDFDDLHQKTAYWWQQRQPL